MLNFIKPFILAATVLFMYFSPSFSSCEIINILTLNQFAFPKETQTCYDVALLLLHMNIYIIYILLHMNIYIYIAYMSK
jgi:hypothetical protein